MNPFKNQDELRQALLELHYGLLDEAEANSLRTAIESDASVAAEWAATLQLANKMADAAKSPSASTLRRARAEVAVSAAGEGPHNQPRYHNQNQSVTLPNAQGHRYSRRFWVGPSLVAAIAACLGFLVIGWRGFEELPPAPVAVVRVEAAVAPSKSAYKSNEFRFVTTRLDGASFKSGHFPLTPAILSFSVLAKSEVLLRGTTQTDSSGTGKIVLPPELVIPKEAQLEVTARPVGGKLAASSVVVPLEPTRCLTYVTVDRPVYRPGETVYFRSLTLERSSLRPLVEVPIRFEVLDPSGAVVAGLFSEGVSDRGVGNGSFMIPSTAPGGPYTLVAKSLDGFFPDERHEFEVRAYRVPRFKTKIEFHHRSYGPGDTVEADFKAERAEGGVVAGAKLRIVAKVDDTIVHEQSTTTTDRGTCLVAFHLPTHIENGVGLLSFVIDDDGTQETDSKTIPIQLGRVAVEFYPEGGYLVDGLNNRVYFTARDTLGKPIHLSGEVQSRSGKLVAKVETTRDGMGRFEFAPERGERYSLKIISPVDVTDTPSLPAVVKDLPVIDTGSGVFDAKQPLTMVIRSSEKRDVLVRAVCRGQLVGEQAMTIESGENSMSLDVSEDAGGVVRVTVLDAGTTPAKPLVERLVYRRQARELSVEIVEADSALERSPGEPLRLTLQVRDETGEPTPAVLGVAVVDDAALSLDKTERPKMTTHFLLTSEVQKPEDLEHANFYLSDGPEATESLDLLLGTQGWRRFISGSSSQPNVDFREQLVRLLELDGNDRLNQVATFESGGVQAQNWWKYREAAASAWRMVMIQVRVFLAIVLVLWVISLAFRMRRLGRVHYVASLLMVSTSLFIYGCGHSANTVVATQSMQEAGDVSAKRFEQSRPARSANEQPSPAADQGMAQGLDLLLRGLRPDSERFGDLQAFRLRGSMSESFPGQTLTPEQLKRLLAARGLDAEALADQLLDELRFPVRQYAHVHSSSESEVRDDFAETLYWQPLLITDSEGRASIRFDLSDSVTTFRVGVDAHSESGRIGSFAGAITSRLPFQLEPKLPLEVTTGDRIDLPIAVINTTSDQVKVELSVSTDGSLATNDSVRSVALAAGQRTCEQISLEVLSGAAEQDASVTIRGVGASVSDSIRRSLHISPAGYPASESIAGRLTGQATVLLAIPKDIVDGSLAVTLRAYPSPLADVMTGIDSILREPHGCFEQTSATNYPNAMALLYLQQSHAANPDIAQRALGMLGRGYDKLTSFECQQRGYEWFGNDPGHEALSAFGLMQFTDMAKVMAVSEEMITRTRVWLMARRDGDGGFKRNPRHLHVWSVQQEVVNAYVLWAITEADVASGQPHRAVSELGKELDTLTQVAEASRDPYLVALSAATLMNIRQTEVGERLLDRLAQLQNADGSLQGATTVVSSGGLSLKMETTALAIIAWAKSPRYAKEAQAAASWITSNRFGSGGFGSTQATVLALKALVAISGQQSNPSGGGTLQVKLAGNVIGEAKLPADARSGSTVEIKGLGEKIAAMANDRKSIELELVATEAKNLSYGIEVAYHAITPSSNENCPLRLKTEFKADFAADGSIKSGDTLQVVTRLTNESDQGNAMTVAIVGLPGGVEPRVQRLDELKAAGEFDYYELSGREVVFYWRTIEPNAIKSIDFDVTATVPGKYTGPASRAYLYYTAEEKHWTEPLQVEIK